MKLHMMKLVNKERVGEKNRKKEKRKCTSQGSDEGKDQGPLCSITGTGYHLIVFPFNEIIPMLSIVELLTVQNSSVLG